jgi:hypothetical protein
MEVDREDAWRCRSSRGHEHEERPDEQKCPQTRVLQLVRIVSGRHLPP